MQNVQQSRQFEAILCDMDGTLVDTELAYDAARREICTKELAFTPTEEEACKLIGMDETEALQILLRSRKLHADVELLIEKVHAIYNRLLRTNLKINPDTIAFLQRVGTLDVKRGLVTGSTCAQACIVIDQICTPGFFGAVITSDDVGRKKPHPEPYLRAAALLQVPPERCVAIEDSPTGVASAIAAGAYCFAVERLPQQEFEHAHEVIQDLSEVPLERLFRMPHAAEI